MKMLKEDLGILALPALLLAAFIGSKIIRLKTSGQPEPNDNVIDAMNAIWKDKQFVKAFAKIIDEVGNYDQILQKINKSLYYKDKGSWNDSEKWWYQNYEKFKPDLTVSEIVSELEQPLIFVPLTVNVDVTFGETIIEGEFAPVLHEYVLAPFAVKVDELPLHITEKEVVAVIVGF